MMSWYNCDATVAPPHLGRRGAVLGAQRAAAAAAARELGARVMVPSWRCHGGITSVGVHRGVTTALQRRRAAERAMRLLLYPPRPHRPHLMRQAASSCIRITIPFYRIIATHHSALRHIEQRGRPFALSYARRQLRVCFFLTTESARPRRGGRTDACARAAS